MISVNFCVTLRKSEGRKICVTKKRKEEIMKKQRIIELTVKVLVAALTAFLTALGTTSCMGALNV